MNLLQVGWFETKVRFTRSVPMLIVALAFLGGVAPGSVQAVEVGPITLAPGEWNKTVPGVNVPPGDSLVVRTVLPEMVCRVPSIAQWRTRIQELANQGSGLRDALVRMEGEIGDGSPERIARAINTFDSRWTPAQFFNANVNTSFEANYQRTQAAWSTGQSLTLTGQTGSGANLWVNCLQLSDAQTLVTRIREIVRRYLAMPPPSVPLQGLPPPQR